MYLLPTVAAWPAFEKSWFITCHDIIAHLSDNEDDLVLSKDGFKENTEFLNMPLENVAIYLEDDLICEAEKL